MSYEAEKEPQPGSPASHVEIVRRTAAATVVDAPVVQAVNAARIPGVGAPPAAPDVPKMLRETLRGRYVLVGVLCLVFAGAFGTLGWMFGKPVYHSEALARIAYSLPEVMQETDQNRPMAMFDMFMLSQRILITSRRVSDMAMQDPVWKAMGRQPPADTDKYFAEHLKVDIRPRSEFIQILVEDNDPAMAAAGVTAVMNAYQDLYNQQEQQRDRARSGTLEQEQQKVQREVDELREQVLAGAKEYGSTRLETFYTSLAAQLTRLDTALAEVRLAIATADTTALATGAAPTTAPAEPVQAPQQAAADAVPDATLLEQLAAFDLPLRALLTEADARKAALDQLLNSGYLEGHQLVVKTRSLLDAANEKVQARLRLQKEMRRVTGRYIGETTTTTPGGGAVPSGTVGRTLTQLQADEVKLTGLQQRIKQEMIAVGLKQIELQKKETDLNEKDSQLRLLSKRIAVLKAEGSQGGRLSIITSGEIPLSPDKDPRRKYAAVGGFFGAMMPIGAVVFFGLVRRKYRYSDETEGEIVPEMPFLGMLPELKPDQPGDDRSIAAAHSLHQIRVSLQSRMPDGNAGTYLVTSAAAGEGKTGLTVALGLSFAAARLRTLVIDCDLVGRNLTSRLGAKGSPGLQEALEAGTLRKLCHRVDGNLAILTAGQGSAADAYAITAPKIRTLLEEARQHFDIVLLDTGPILGSVEASIVAREVDGVVLTVSRGRERVLVRSAMQRLDALGGRALGFVFNRADYADFDRSPYSTSSVRTIPDPENKAPALVAPEAGSRWKNFGPLVQAVASGVSGLHN